MLLLAPELLKRYEAHHQEVKAAQAKEAAFWAADAEHTRLIAQKRIADEQAEHIRRAKIKQEADEATRQLTLEEFHRKSEAFARAEREKQQREYEQRQYQESVVAEMQRANRIAEERKNLEQEAISDAQERERRRQYELRIWEINHPRQY